MGYLHSEGSQRQDSVIQHYQYTLLIKLNQYSKMVAAVGYILRELRDGILLFNTTSTYR